MFTLYSKAVENLTAVEGGFYQTKIRLHCTLPPLLLCFKQSLFSPFCCSPNLLPRHTSFEELATKMHCQKLLHGKVQSHLDLPLRPTVYRTTGKSAKKEDDLQKILQICRPQFAGVGLATLTSKVEAGTRLQPSYWHKVNKLKMIIINQPQF